MTRTSRGWCMEILQNDHELWDILEDGLNNEKKYGR